MIELNNPCKALVAFLTVLFNTVLAKLHLAGDYTLQVTTINVKFGDYNIQHMRSIPEECYLKIPTGPTFPWAPLLCFLSSTLEEGRPFTLC